MWRRKQSVFKNKEISIVRRNKSDNPNGAAKHRGGRALVRVSPPQPSHPAPLKPARPNVELTLKHFNRRIERNQEKRLYLGVGDEVNHLRYEEWGIGVVMEVMTSSVPGGTCLARVRFQDGQLRCFNNDLDNEACCYYFGVRRYWNPTHGVESLRAKFFYRG